MDRREADRKHLGRREAGKKHSALKGAERERLDPKEAYREHLDLKKAGKERTGLLGRRDLNRADRGHKDPRRHKGPLEHKDHNRAWHIRTCMGLADRVGSQIFVDHHMPEYPGLREDHTLRYLGLPLESHDPEDLALDKSQDLQ